ncbi:MULTISPECIES: hypothetical protein [unclassified Pseudomonas]|nr:MULTISPECIES: hypothetical protein [unclassified Pseudomonas]
MRRFGFACFGVALTLSTIYVLKTEFVRPSPMPPTKHPIVSMSDLFKHM